MSKVTSKLQVTVSKALAERYGIRPGDDIRFEGAGEVMRVVPASAGAPPREGLDIEARLRLFDAATERQRKRERHRRAGRAGTRGWIRDEFFERGHTDAD